jgi:phospholipid/cholesterol/gamma-HCH transport system permease protein
MTARGGTQGVGRATTQAVVAASVLIVVVNFFVTQFLMNVLQYK